FSQDKDAGRPLARVAEGVSPEVRDADREDGRPRRRGCGCGEAEIPRRAALQGAAPGAFAGPSGEVAARRDVIPEAAQRRSGTQLSHSQSRLDGSRLSLRSAGMTAVPIAFSIACSIVAPPSRLAAR